MLSKLKKSKSEGFTIIEVMIVLAIAALILLIVLIAVPALQRSSRNTQRKNDASAIAGAVANFISNNSGDLPKLVADNGTTSAVAVLKTAGASSPNELAKLGFFTTKGNISLANAVGQDGNIYISAAATPVAAATVAAVGSETSTAVSTDTLAIIYGQDCTPTANSRTAAIYYVTESGNGNGTLQCTEQ